jgi:outer membrane receptor protein involved in Fe transport
MDFSFDGDWGNEAYWGIYAPYQFFEDITRLRRTVTQELRASSSDDAARVRWVAGVYALRLTERYSLTDTYNGELYNHIDSDYSATNLAAYAQLDFDPAARWTLSAGLRGERRKARYLDSNALREDPVDDMTGGHVSVTWHAAPGRDAYLALTRGYKAGGINTGADVPQPLRTYDPEFLWNLEAGLKTRSEDGRFDTQTSVFFMQRTDEQVASSYQSDPSDPLTFLLYTANAARGRNYGIEAQLGWRPAPALRLGATLGLLRAPFQDYVVAGRNLDGRQQPNAPEYQVGATLDAELGRGFFVHLDANAVDAFYFSASHDQRSTPYELVNLRLGWHDDRWRATVWARNLFNQGYAVHGFYFGNEPPDFPNKRYIQNGDPRQLGASLTVSF